MSPRVHYRLIGSTNARARELAAAGAPHGTVVTADEQSEGRGRQGRTWSAPPGRALLCSVVVRDPPALLPLAAGVAVAEVVGPDARIKWPNDVLVWGRKVAGILAEGRPQEGWAVVGIGLNVALRVEDFPVELRSTAGTLGLEPSAIEPTLEALLEQLERWVTVGPVSVVAAVRERDALLGREVRWAGGVGVGGRGVGERGVGERGVGERGVGERGVGGRGVGGRAVGGRGVGAGIDSRGRLVVETEDGTVALDAGEVHLMPGEGVH